MKSWKRVKNCQICGESRCKENEWLVYCFRFNRAYNKKQIGIEGQGNIVPLQGVLEGQRPSKGNPKEIFTQNLFDENDLIFFDH